MERRGFIRSLLGLAVPLVKKTEEQPEADKKTYDIRMTLTSDGAIEKKGWLCYWADESSTVRTSRISNQ